MKLFHNLATIAVISFVALSSFAATSQAAGLKSAPKQHALGFKANQGGGQSQGHTETCNNAASCNLMIAYCDGKGKWTETGSPGPQGEPIQGQCVYP